MTNGELTNLPHIASHTRFDSEIAERFGPDADPDDFPDINMEEMSAYNLYDDETSEDGLQGSPDDEENTSPATDVPTPEAGDTNVHVWVMLLRGDKFVCGRVV